MKQFLAMAVLLASSGWATAVFTVATGLSNPGGLTVANGTVYFASTVGSSRSIQSVSTNGGAVTSLYNNLITPNDLAVIGNTLFWVDANSGPITDTQILMAPLAGGGTITPIYTGSQVGQPLVDGDGLVTDGSKLYVTDEVAGAVFSLNPDGSALTQLGPDRYAGGFGAEHGNFLTEANGILYVDDGGRSGVDSPQVVSIPVGGAPSFAPLWVGAPFNVPIGITEGNGLLYIADGSTIWSMPITGGTPTVFYSGDPLVDAGAAGIYYDNGSIYFADNGAGAIFRIDTTPEPGSALLIGIGLTLVGFVSWKRRMNERGTA